MTPLERQHLETLCGKLNVDGAEIDSTASYYENKTQLLKFRLKTIDDLVEEYSKKDLRGTLSDFDEWYLELSAKVGHILESNRIGTLLDWYAIGKEVVLARAEQPHLRENHELVKTMNKLARDHHRRVEEVYDALRFAERYPNWDGFGKQEFDIPRSKRGVLKLSKMSGWGLSWNQVRTYLLRGKTIKDIRKPNCCWSCGKAFFSDSAHVCAVCKTFLCPDGHCFCKLPRAVQVAVDYEIRSRGPQPPRWKRGRTHEKKQMVPSYNDFSGTDQTVESGQSK